jgi:hypothetical protein
VKQYLGQKHKDATTGKPKKFRVRADTLGYAQRCMAGLVSPIDSQEAYEAGVAAVRYAMRGDIDGSVCFRRLPSTLDKYFGDLFLAPLEDVSGVNLPKASANTAAWTTPVWIPGCEIPCRFGQRRHSGVHRVAAAAGGRTASQGHSSRQRRAEEVIKRHGAARRCQSAESDIFQVSDASFL